MLDTIFLGCRVATLWEIASHLVSRFFSLYFVFFVILVISHFGFKSRIWLLIAPVPVHCVLVTFKTKQKTEQSTQERCSFLFVDFIKSEEMALGTIPFSLERAPAAGTISKLFLPSLV